MSGPSLVGNAGTGRGRGFCQVDWNAGIALDVHSRACERNADCCIDDKLWVAASPRRASRQPCAISPPSKTRTSPKEFTRPGGPWSSPRCRRGSQRSTLHAWSYPEPWSGAVAAACTQCLAGSFWRCRASAVATGCPTLPYPPRRTRTLLLIRSSRREPRHSRGPRPGPLLDPEASTLRRRPRCGGVAAGRPLVGAWCPLPQARAGPLAATADPHCKQSVARHLHDPEPPLAAEIVRERVATDLGPSRQDELADAILQVWPAHVHAHTCMRVQAGCWIRRPGARARPGTLDPRCRPLTPRRPGRGRKITHTTRRAS